MDDRRVTRALRTEHLEALRQQRLLAVVATADGHGQPHVSVVSWLCLVDPGHVTLAMDRRTQHFRNIERNPRIALSIMADGVVLALGGTARLARHRMTSVPWETAMVSVTLDLVVDQTLPGVDMTGPRYAYTEDKQHRYDAETAILAELAVPGDACRAEVRFVEEPPPRGLPPRPAERKPT
jgi:hypothetical protein